MCFIGYGNGDDCCLYFLLHLTYIPSSTPVGHVAMTTLLHRVLTFASPHESPISFSCTITVFRHVVFGRPGSLLLGRVHLRATLGICLYAFSRRVFSRQSLISRTALLQPADWWSSTLYFLLGQNIQQIFLKHPLWKALIFAMSTLTTSQHSQPYRKINVTLLL